MAIDFKLPDIGEGIAEGEIVKWLVSAGDAVEEHQPIVEVMTDKATVELPAPAAGRVTELMAEEGEVVPVGKVIFRLETDGDSQAEPRKAEPRKAEPRQAEPRQAEPRKAERGKAEPAPEAKRARAEGSRAPEARGARADESGSRRDSDEPRPEGSRAQAPSQAPSQAPKARSESEPQGESPPKSPSSSRPRTSPTSGGGRRLEFKLPDIGEGIAEGEIVKWLVSEGDSLEEHQPVVEVMTDKATVELPAPAAGTLEKILAKEGEVVPVGQVIFELRTGEARAEEAEESRDEEEPAEAVGGDGGGSTRERPERGERTQRERAAPSGRAQAAAVRGADEKVLAVPSARRVARELGIDLGEVPGSGRNGVIRRADVEAFARSGEAAEREPAAPAREGTAQRKAAPSYQAPAGVRSEERIPFRGVRRKIAEAMTRSMFTAPHFTVVEEVDVTELVALRAKAKALGESAGVKVTYMPFIMKATALALVKYPMLNGRLDEETNELVRPSYADLGIAIDTPSGLIVPVLRDVQTKGILQLASELAELSERTRTGKVKPDELRGSTFSITNAGNIGGILATPIINFPDIAILGIHRIRKAPGVIETPQGDRIEVRQYMNLSLSVDHRLADGADGARMLVYMKQLLESPGLLAL